MSELTPFVFPDTRGSVGTVESSDGTTWFVSEDVCSVLEIRSRDALSALDEDEKVREVIAGTVIDLMSESGVYSTIMRSRKPEAKRFKRWITSEVIPQIRKTGAYSNTPKSFAEALQLAADSQREIERFASFRNMDYDHIRRLRVA